MPMKKLIFFAFIFSFIFSCERNPDKINSEYIATIVAFDPNCSTCILEFPYDYLQVKQEFGESPDNYYQAINLSDGNYEIGQKLKVKIRKPETKDARACRTMFPTYNYRSVFITDFENFNNLILNDTIILSYRDCLYDPEDKIYICLDSVLNDSRCPTGVYCFWEGNAEVRFKYEKINNGSVLFNLNTHTGFTNSTIVDGYKFTLIGLSPYPSVKHRTTQKDYKAKLVVEKIK
jgi:hypothetical protein